MVQLAEVRKFWTKDPLQEGGFADLLSYDPKKDVLSATPTLQEGESEVLKSVAGRVKEWAGDWPAVWHNIVLRGKVKEELVRVAVKAKRMDLLEAEFVVQANDEFHIIADSVRKEIGSTDPKRIYEEWNSWLRRSIK
jgi:hypothetical protein